MSQPYDRRQYIPPAMPQHGRPASQVASPSSASYDHGRDLADHDLDRQSLELHHPAGAADAYAPLSSPAESDGFLPQPRAPFAQEHGNYRSIPDRSPDVSAPPSRTPSPSHHPLSDESAQGPMAPYPVQLNQTRRDTGGAQSDYSDAYAFPTSDASHVRSTNTSTLVGGSGSDETPYDDEKDARANTNANGVHVIHAGLAQAHHGRDLAPRAGGKPPGPDDALPPPSKKSQAAPLVKANRTAWIDGIRGIASVVIFTHHFSDLTWSSIMPNTLPPGSLGGLFRNGQLALAMYYLLGGRVLAVSFLRSAFKAKALAEAASTEPGGFEGGTVLATIPTGPRDSIVADGSSAYGDHGSPAYPNTPLTPTSTIGRHSATSDAPKEHEKGLVSPAFVGVPRPLDQPRWATLSSSIFRRSIRLAVPAMAVGLIQWLLGAHNALGDKAIEASTQFLHPSDLWAPTWGQIGSFAGFLRFSLGLFTNQNHTEMLTLGAQLWTTYDQFWGSIMVYILATAVAFLPARSRYSVYAAVVVVLWWITSPNFLYVVGLAISDAYAAGYVRKIQDMWHLTFLLELCFMTLALAFIIGGGTVATPADSYISQVTVYAGKFGYDQSTTWPQEMYMSNWIPTVMAFCWVELSHAMQWLCSWRIFTWMGKVAYGFYLMQFISLYLIVPPLALYFHNHGRSFWGAIIPTYIITLLFNFLMAWLAYHIFDRTGLKLGKAAWDGLFMSKATGGGDFFHMPARLVRFLVDYVIRLPGRVVRGTAKSFVQKGKATKSFVHTVFNWRTLVRRPPPRMPSTPDELAELYSTAWTSDLSNDKEAVRTAKLLRFQSYSWIIQIWLIPAITIVWVWFHPTGNWTWDALTISSLWRFMWVLAVPNCLAAYLGFITPDTSLPKKDQDKKPVHREYIRNFYIALVTKGSNEVAVRRGYQTLEKLEVHHPAIKTYVLTDEPYAYPDLKNIVCPKSYKSARGLAKYKARALDHFRVFMKLNEFDWVLHMDEESITDAESVRRMFDLIRYTPHHYAQGIILYNGEGYWKNWYFTVADGLRVGDDLARFHFQNTVINRPIFGVHGSFLLMNGEVENNVTWDFGTLAEDFEFSQEAWRQGFTVGRVHGIVREQSPTTLPDFLKQRRRWFVGIQAIKGVHGFPHLAINLWIVGVFCLGATLINIPFSFVDYSLTPFWIAVCADFSLATFEVLYLWGLLFQDIDAGVPWYLTVIHLPCAVVIQPFAAISEGLAAIWGMASEGLHTFDVIVKK